MVMGGGNEAKSSCLIKRNEKQTAGMGNVEGKPAPAAVVAAAAAAAAPPPAILEKPLSPPPPPPSAIPLENTPPPSEILEEVSSALHLNENDTISLKNPNEVYYTIYRKAREKAKEMRLRAIEAYLAAKEIKTKYMLFDMDDTDEDSEEEEEEEEEEEDHN